jgi:GTP cyclohydrolase I
LWMRGVARDNASDVGVFASAVLWLLTQQCLRMRGVARERANTICDCAYGSA